MKVEWQIAVLLPLFYSACGNKQAERTVTVPSKTYTESSININKKLLNKESQDIDNWLNRHKIKAEKTGTGLRYFKIKEGHGNLAQPGQWATIDYKVSLLDGTFCYDTKEGGPETFLIEQDQVESGLHEGIQKMHVGDKFLFILPPHLAHGLLGDDKKIPPLSTILYEVELLKIKNAP